MYALAAYKQLAGGEKNIANVCIMLVARIVRHVAVSMYSKLNMAASLGEGVCV